MDYSSKEFEARYHYDGGDLGVRRKYKTERVIPYENGNRTSYTSF